MWTGKHVLVLGAARQGIALARWLTRHGARVTLSDSRSEAELTAARAALADLAITWAPGGHPLDLLEGCDLACLSGGVPLNLPIVTEAVQRGIPLSNDTQVFMEVVPCRTLGITGSAGKTTTTTLVGRMAKSAYETMDDGPLTKEGPNVDRPSSIVHVGGNLGDPLLNHVDEMKPDDLAILEISSFQLEQMSLSPDVAAVLNITPNHLDRHGTMETYTSAKARLLEFQSAQDAAVLGRDDPGAWGLRDRVKGRTYAFSLHDLDDGLDGAYLHDDMLHLRDGKAYLPLLPREKIHLPGLHNLGNVLAAFAIGHAAGLPLDAMLGAAEEFRGVPHRLELVRELRGVRWYNDSIATAPERTMAGIRSFDEPLVLLLGGRDKDLPWDNLAALVRQRVEHVILFGEAAGRIEATLGPASGRTRTIVRCETLYDAVCRAADVAEAGDVVLLAPGGTSYDAFKDFEERGERYRQWVLELS